MFKKILELVHIIFICTFKKSFLISMAPLYHFAPILKWYKFRLIHYRFYCKRFCHTNAISLSFSTTSHWHDDRRSPKIWDPFLLPFSTDECWRNCGLSSLLEWVWNKDDCAGNRLRLDGFRLHGLVKGNFEKTLERFFAKDLMDRDGAEEESCRIKAGKWWCAGKKEFS